MYEEKEFNRFPPGRRRGCASPPDRLRRTEEGQTVQRLFRATNQAQIHEALPQLFAGRNKGGRIPAEAELAKRYGVSRSAIREVLKRREFEGSIVRKRGSGAYAIGFVQFL